MKWLVALAVAAAMVACTAGLAVMSIDFGSEFMKIAIVKPGVPMEIALNKESRRKTPVIVSMKNGERLFSDPAANLGIRFPKNAYKFLLDLVGKKVSNPAVQLYMKRFPYYEIESDPDTGMVVFRHDKETTYSVEELIGMVLEKARMIATDYAEQPITEAVITVPPYFNQAERRAMLRAGEIGGLKVLQLLNDNTAVALNYGVFRRKEFNATVQNYMFFDMGSSSTTSTIVSYQVVKAKNPATGIEETFPQLTIKGIGFDRSLGGLAYDLRLRDDLAKLFNKNKKTSSEVTENPRAMAKLLKEAARVKQVLSANNDHFAQIEGLLDDEDFRAKVSRQDFEDSTSDLSERVGQVINDALKSSEVTMSEITDVILMGAATRIPKVQAVMQETLGRQELGKSINTDEAAALGGSFQAAHLSKGFKVQKFGIKDANIFPIQVEFERVKATEDPTDEPTKTVKRTLFGKMNPYPQKKVMTFNKHVKDFNFVVNYGDLDFLREDFLQTFGKNTLQEVALIGIEDAHEKHLTDAEPKGTKAHFRMDESGILTIDKVETLFEKMVHDESEDDKKEESTFSKIGNTISNFFGGSEKSEEKEGSVEEPKDDEKAETEDQESQTKEGENKKSGEEETKEKTDEDKNEAEKEKSDKDEKTDSEQKQEEPAKEEEKEQPKTESDKPAAEEKDETKDKTESKEDGEKEGEGKEEEKPQAEKKEKKKKPVTVKEEIKSETLLVDLRDPSDDMVKVSKKKIKELRESDQEKDKLEKIKNELEGFIFDTQEKLYQEEYETCSQEEEREKIRTQLSETSDWLYEQDASTERKAYEGKLRDLKKLTSELYMRVLELQERPQAMETLNTIMNYTEYFLGGMKNLTGEDEPFTDIELETLEKLITTTKEWNATVQEEQKNTPAYEKPKLLLEDIGRKISDLDREVKYLLNKMKTFKPKPKPKPENKTESANETKTETKPKKTDTKQDKKETLDTNPDATETLDTNPDATEAPSGEESEKQQTSEDDKIKEEEEPLQLPEASEETTTKESTTEESTTEESTTKNSEHDPNEL